MRYYLKFSNGVYILTNNYGDSAESKDLKALLFLRQHFIFINTGSTGIVIN